jgi:DNA-binding NarL/FixJ family response regulator
MINVILADHQPIFRTGTARVLASEDDIRIVGQPESCRLMINAARLFRPQVVMLSRPFLEALPEIAKLASNQGFSLMMIAEKGESSTEYVEIGFKGVIYRSAEPSAVVTAVRRLARGQSFVQPDYPASTEGGTDYVSPWPNTRLTSRELSIVRGVLRGNKNRQIGLQLGCSEQVIKNLLRGIFDKLGVSDRLELALHVLHHKPSVLAASLRARSEIAASVARTDQQKLPQLLS